MGICAKLPQLCLTLCDAMDYNLPGSSVHGISRQEYWSGLPCSPPGDLTHPGVELESRGSPALAGWCLPLVPPGKPDGYVMDPTVTQLLPVSVVA